MDELLGILAELKPGVDFTKEKDFVEQGILDSIEIMELADEIMDTFDIELTPVDIVPENFASVEALYQMIQKKQEED